MNPILVGIWEHDGGDDPSQFIQLGRYGSGAVWEADQYTQRPLNVQWVGRWELTEVDGEPVDIVIDELELVLHYNPDDDVLEAGDGRVYERTQYPPIIAEKF
jgi:hypothetical protein